MLRAIIRRILNAPAIHVALERAASRGLLPSALGSAALRARFLPELRDRSVFSARTTQAEYLQGIRDAIDLALAGGRGNDLPQLRLELKQLIARLGYTPEGGFPGDAEMGIPPAEPGSLQDLSSDRRINFILDTQIRLARGASQKARGLEPDRLAQFPAYELVRVLTRDVPRGSEGSNSLGWAERWVRAEGPLITSGRLIAGKTDPVWARLGDADRFDDALGGVDHPPFAYNSGMGWREVAADEARAAGLDLSPSPSLPVSDSPNLPLPDPMASVRRLDPDLRAELLRQVKAKRAEKADHIRYAETLDREVENAREAYAMR